MKNQGREITDEIPDQFKGALEAADAAVKAALASEATGQDGDGEGATAAPAAPPPEQNAGAATGEGAQGQEPAPPVVEQKPAAGVSTDERNALEAKLRHAEEQARWADIRLREANGKLQAIEARVEALTAQMAKAPAAPTVPASLAKLTEEEREALKDQPMPVEARMAEGMVDEVRQRTEARLAEMQSRLDAMLQERQAAEARSEFEAAVETQIPGFAKANASDAAWHAFLNTPDPMDNTGLTRGQVAQGFIAERGPTAAKVRYLSQLWAEFKGNGKAAAVAPQVAAQVKPGTARAGASATNAGAPVFYASDLETLSVKAARDALTPQDEQQMREIELALMEGRLRPGRRPVAAGAA